LSAPFAHHSAPPAPGSCICAPLGTAGGGARAAAPRPRGPSTATLSPLGPLPPIDATARRLPVGFVARDRRSDASTVTPNGSSHLPVLRILPQRIEELRVFRLAVVVVSYALYSLPSACSCASRSRAGTGPAVRCPFRVALVRRRSRSVDGGGDTPWPASGPAGPGPTAFATLPGGGCPPVDRQTCQICRRSGPLRHVEDRRRSPHVCCSPVRARVNVPTLFASSRRCCRWPVASGRCLWVRVRRIAGAPAASCGPFTFPPSRRGTPACSPVLRPRHRVRTPFWEAVRLGWGLNVPWCTRNLWLVDAEPGCDRAPFCRPRAPDLARRTARAACLIRRFRSVCRGFGAPRPR